MLYFSEKFICASKEYCTLEKHIPAPYLRRNFTWSKGRKAKIVICGLGFYELFINGKKITKGKLSSYISNPDDVLYYDDYDITSYLHDGKTR